MKIVKETTVVADEKAEATILVKLQGTDYLSELEELCQTWKDKHAELRNVSGRQALTAIKARVINQAGEHVATFDRFDDVRRAAKFLKLQQKSSIEPCEQTTELCEQVWVDAYGHAHKVQDMTEIHVYNTLKFLVRNIIDLPQVRKLQFEIKRQTGMLLGAKRRTPSTTSLTSFIDDCGIDLARDLLRFCIREFCDN